MVNSADRARMNFERNHGYLVNVYSEVCLISNKIGGIKVTLGIQQFDLLGMSTVIPGKDKLYAQSTHTHNYRHGETFSVKGRIYHSLQPQHNSVILTIIIHWAVDIGRKTILLCLL